LISSSLDFDFVPAVVVEGKVEVLFKARLLPNTGFMVVVVDVEGFFEFCFVAAS
jgi:hypothetical protein